MGVGDLTPGTVYFLELEPAGGFGPFPFYKLGFTDEPIRKRLNNLKTGNPFKIIERDSFYTKAAGLIECKLHAKYRQTRQLLEWYRFDTEEAIDEAIALARKWDEDLSDTVARVKELDQTASSGEIIKATPEVLELAKEYEKKDRQQQTAKRERDGHWQIILKEALKQGALFRNVLYTSTKQTNPPGIDWNAVMERNPDQWSECRPQEMIWENDSLVNPQYTVGLGQIPWPAGAKELRKANKSNIDAMQDMFKSEGVKEMEPNEIVLERQEEMDKKDRQLGYLKYEMLELKYKIALICGTNPGIDGVFTWERTKVENTGRLKKTFKTKYPNLLTRKAPIVSKDAGSVELKFLKPERRTNKDGESL